MKIRIKTQKGIKIKELERLTEIIYLKRNQKLIDRKKLK